MSVSINNRLWSISLTSALLFAIIINCVCSRILFSSFGLAVNKNNRRRTRTDVATLIIPDDYGESYKNAYTAIGKSRQIASFRRPNSTIVAYTLGLKKACLEESIGCKPLHSLGSVGSLTSPQHYVLVSGVVGDCRVAVRHLKQLALNHTFQFSSEASGEFLANGLGRFLRNSRQGDRSLAVHAYVISRARHVDRRKNERTSGTSGTSGGGCIFEVGATGSVTRVRGGTIGGSHTKQARRHLEEHYRDNLTEVECRALVNEVFDPQLNSLDADREGGSDTTEMREIVKPVIEYIEIYDT